MHFSTFISTPIFKKKQDLCSVHLQKTDRMVFPFVIKTLHHKNPTLIFYSLAYEKFPCRKMVEKCVDSEKAILHSRNHGIADCC